MSHIGVIQLMQREMGIKRDFAYLDSLDIEKLDQIRDKLVTKWNQFIEDKKCKSQK